eukprot:CAMPEP_0170193182 /NCGR_PEP_ID=MMETSP0040_2-20121228/56309_1 /TAXON_ID=641309 /ORGANISM="Lotharella oceanica, Strain CCMP622" /LENGTH=48 /DNA_ID= /DNA_START= /DNA_END= /DNA_ORIENTATION=
MLSCWEESGSRSSRAAFMLFMEVDGLGQDRGAGGGVGVEDDDDEDDSS